MFFPQYAFVTSILLIIGNVKKKSYFSFYSELFGLIRITTYDLYGFFKKVNDFSKTKYIDKSGEALRNSHVITGIDTYIHLLYDVV